MSDNRQIPPSNNANKARGGAPSSPSGPDPDALARESAKRMTAIAAKAITKYANGSALRPSLRRWFLRPSQQRLAPENQPAVAGSCLRPSLCWLVLQWTVGFHYKPRGRHTPRATAQYARGRSNTRAPRGSGGHHTLWLVQTRSLRDSAQIRQTTAHYVHTRRCPRPPRTPGYRPACAGGV